MLLPELLGARLRTTLVLKLEATRGAAIMLYTAPDPVLLNRLFSARRALF